MIKRISSIIILTLITLSSHAQRSLHLNDFIIKYNMNGLVKSEKLMVQEKIYPEPTYYPGEIVILNEWGEKVTVDGF